MSSGDLPGHSVDPLGADSLDDCTAALGSMAPTLYTQDEWAAMSEHDRQLLREYRAREVELARRAHHARARLLESLTLERFTRDDE